MKEIEDAIERLRRATRQEMNLGVLLGMFHDELAMNPALLRASIPAENPSLERTVIKAAQYVDPSTRAGPFTLLRVGGFWHGFVLSSSGVVVLYYFEQEDVGVIGFVAEGRSEIVRFSVLKLSSNTTLMRGPRGSG